MFKFIGKLTALLWHVFWHPDYTIVSRGMFPGRTDHKEDYRRLGKINRASIILLQFFHLIWLPGYGIFLIWASGQFLEKTPDLGDRVLGLLVATTTWVLFARAFWPGIYNIPWSIRNFAKARGTKSGPR